jgi:hypothetical protein
VYVDDMLLIRNNKEIIQDVKIELSSKLDMKYLLEYSIILRGGVNLYCALFTIFYHSM